MILFILAALGVISIVMILLFRRARDIQRQQAETSRRLDDMARQFTLVYVEIYRELLHLQRHSADTLASPGPLPEAAAVNGAAPRAGPAGPKPARVKGRLSLFVFVAVPAFLGSVADFLTEAYREHRGYVMGTAIGSATVGVTAVTVLTIAPWREDMDARPPSFAPTATATQLPTALPNIPQPTSSRSGPTGPPSPSGSPSALAISPSESPVPSESASPSPEPTTSVVPAGEEPAAPSGLPTPSGTGPTGETPPAVEESPAPPAPVSSPPSSPSPVGSGLCVVLTVSPILDVGICLPVLGGG